jgi:hypothetical protein
MEEQTLKSDSEKGIEKYGKFILKEVLESKQA